MTDPIETAEALRERRRLEESRRTFLGWTLFGAAAFAVLLTLILTLSWHAADDRAKTNQKARICIAQGGSWINQNCLQPGKAR